MLLSNLTTRTGFVAALLAGAMALGLGAARADDAIFVPGEPIVTGFAGTVVADTVPDGADPLDYTFIDLDGPSAAIQQLQPDGPAAGQLLDTSPVFAASARDVGQVFGVTLDDAPDSSGALAPNIYLAATSAFGLNIVVPDADGNPVRSKSGAADATWMAGQWGSAGGAEGYPGSIWKVDGTTGEISLFSTIAANSGAGLSGIVYDASSAQFFVADRDTGLIYRLGADGTIIDTYDHGVVARPTHGLDAVEDDGSTVDITDPAFNTEDPTSWGITQPEREVTGLAVRGGRLYYAVADGPSIWSVRINADGSFGTPRWELDVTGLPSANAIASIVFDAQGRMILAQRGTQVGSYDYSVFATAGDSSVVRYKREFPDDPTTPSTWSDNTDSYVIGLASEGTAASGGIALGYGFSTEAGDFTGACNATLWATGDALRNNADLDPPVDGPMQVSGLQGMARTLVRPANDPATHSFFADYDGNTDDATSTEAGHVGAVAIWQVCDGPTAIPDVEPPDFVPPPDYVMPEDYNLTLEKWAQPHFCFTGPTDYWCNYTIRVENTGTVPYWGPVSVHDYLPAAPAGSSQHFWPTPPWFCAPAGPNASECQTGPVLLFPGDGVVLHEVVKVPKPATGFCVLPNVASIDWPFFSHDDDPSDDFGMGIAGIASPGCVPPGPGVTDLTLKKIALPNCIDVGPDFACSYAVIVQNAGPGNYTGPIQVKDTLGVNVPATVVGPWTCVPAGATRTCNINVPPVNVPPGWTSGFVLTAKVHKPVGPPLCDLDNKAQIAAPIGGSPNNVVPGNDFDTASAHIPTLACAVPHADTDLEIKKVPQGCFAFGSGYVCKWQLTLTNVGPDNYIGPLTFKDSSALALGNTLTSALSWCAGTSNVTCTHPGSVFLASGAPHSISFYTAYNGGPSVCSATNEVSILDPNPGSVSNPSGNDSASTAQAIPNPACGGGPALNIQKTAKGCIDDPGSTDWLCKFEIKVLNYGSATQPLPLQVRDWSNKPTTFSGAVCPPVGPTTWLCSKSTPLNSGATWTITATSHVDPNGLTLADCNVIDKVWIWTPWSADPGHFAEATQKVPQLVINLGPGPHYVYCDPPSLKLAKTAGACTPAGDGFDCAFTVTATSTGPDPYQGTVEVDENLPAGTTYKSSNWTCVPNGGNDVHCSSPPKTMPVGKFTAMNITMHVPKATAVGAKCNLVNEAEVSIPAEVLHSDAGVQYIATAKAKLPASACREAPACSVTQQKPDGSCCPPDQVWNGKQCAPPKPVPPKCPDDSHLNDAGACVCDKGTTGKPGQCKPIVVVPTCPNDSHLNDAGACVCDKGTTGKPGQCKPIVVTPNCPDDSHLSKNGRCVCNDGFQGKPGLCTPVIEQPTCPDDSHLDKNGRCVCNPPLTGRPGQCQLPQVEVPSCPDDSHLGRNGKCICNEPLTGRPGQCQLPQVVIDQPPQPEKPTCPDDSHLNKRGACVCNEGTTGKPGACTAVLTLQLPVLK